MNARKLHRLLKILVPTDFSASADAAVDYASFLARRFGADIDLLYVWNLLSEARQGVRTTPFSDSVAGAAMHRCLSTKRDAALRIRGRVEFGELGPTILRVATADDFDLIVMGLHGHTRPSNAFNGNVASEVARHAACPVIMIRAFMTEATVREAQESDDASLERWADDGGNSVAWSPPPHDSTGLNTLGRFP